MDTVWQAQKRNWKIRHPPVTQQSTPNTPAGLITTILVKVITPAKVLAEDLTKPSLQEVLPNLVQMHSSAVGKQITSESMDSCHMSGFSRTHSSLQQLGFQWWCSRWQQLQPQQAIERSLPPCNDHLQGEQAC